ncbi:MAG: DNA-processing protein DprA, partial [Burkholderiaceae bacterium]|nr:DNA-processing protein DprA [Burkholderiaceae bacterium]
AEKIAEALGHAGLTIVSGMALGIDAAAHYGGLATAAATIAVVGTGADKVYPSRNHALAHRIAEEGCLVGEYPLGTPALPANFPRRNRIISGLSCGVLVVEATKQSGSLITARMALEQGRDVFAVPGSIHSPLSGGCHQLIRQGAKLVETAQDILEELPEHRTGLSRAESSRATDDTGNLSSVAHAILHEIGFSPMDVETLSQLVRADMASLNAELLTLELAGKLECLPGGAYRRLVS